MTRIGRLMYPYEYLYRAIAICVNQRLPVPSEFVTRDLQANAFGRG